MTYGPCWNISKDKEGRGTHVNTGNPVHFQTVLLDRASSHYTESCFPRTPNLCCLFCPYKHTKWIQFLLIWQSFNSLKEVKHIFARNYSLVPQWFLKSHSILSWSLPFPQTQMASPTNVLFPGLKSISQAWVNRNHHLHSPAQDRVKHKVSSVQFSRSVVSDSLQPHESQHTRPPCPSPAPGVYSNSCQSSQWCHPDISFSVVPFSSCP